MLLGANGSILSLLANTVIDVGNRRLTLLTAVGCMCGLEVIRGFALTISTGRRGWISWVGFYDCLIRLKKVSVVVVGLMTDEYCCGDRCVCAVKVRVVLRLVVTGIMPELRQSVVSSRFLGNYFYILVFSVDLTLATRACLDITVHDMGLECNRRCRVGVLLFVSSWIDVAI